MRRLDLNKIVIYLSLAITISLAGVHLPLLFGMEEGEMFTTIAQLLLYSWGPALAVMLIQRFLYKGSLEVYGWTRRHLSFPWLFRAMLWPLGVTAGIIGFAFVLGNLFGLPGFGEVIMGDPMGGSEAAGWFRPYLEVLYTGPMMPNELWFAIAMLVVLGPILGATLNLFFNIGEEVGWRGFMLAETKKLGFMGGNFITGILWSVWALPLFFLYPPEMEGETLWYVVGLFGYNISMSFPMAYLSLKSRSVYPAAIFAGVMSNLSAIPFFFIWGEAELLGGAKGLVAMFALLLLTFLILRYDPKFVEDYPELEFVDDDE
ncbi:MAG: CPBP family glutamic-type intramembrane protease, partial [Bacteroidota bacterium]